MKIETMYSALIQAGKYYWDDRPRTYIRGASQYENIRDGIVRRYERLQAENARLKLENTQWPEKWKAAIDTYSSLLHKELAENARLRAALDATRAALAVYENKPYTITYKTRT